MANKNFGLNIKNMRPTILILLVTLIFSCSGKKKDVNNLDTHGVIESDGIKFNYVRQGKGERLLVIGSSVYYPKAFSDSLRDNFEMIFVDSRHFIPTYDPTDQELANLSLTTWADDLEKARTKLNLDKVTVIGHSIHAQIAIEYAKKYPDNVSRLLLICGVPYSFAELSDEVDELWTKDADQNRKTILNTRLLKQDSIMSATPANKQFSVSYDLNAPRYWTDPNYDAKNLLNDLLTSPKAFEKLFNSIPSKQEVTTKLAGLKMPTLVIVGRLDFACPYTAWEQILPGTNIDYQLMQDASHNPQTEKTTALKFDRILKTWISKKR